MREHEQSAAGASAVNAEPVPSTFVALAIVRNGDRFLLVEEHDGRWSLPGGRVEPREAFASAAVRECLEETGVAIELEAVARIEHTPRPNGSIRVRVYFVARPSSSTTTKSVADEHSVRAAWLTAEEVAGLRLRAPEVALAVRHVAEARTRFADLAILSAEGRPW